MPAKLHDTLKISKVSGDNWYLPKDMPGYIGAGYEFKLGGNFEVAELTFKFDKKFLNIPEFEPAIYYCDEENQEMILLENQEIDLNAGSVTSKINHFSKYILLNKTDFEKGFSEPIKIPTDTKNLDIVFVIDRSYSMDWNDANCIRKDVSKNLINSLTEKDRVGVVSFSKYAYNLCTLTNNMSTACAHIDSIKNSNGYESDAGTALHRGLNAALSQFATSNTNTYKIIVALTDGEDTDSGDYSAIINRAIKNNVIIHTVGLKDADEILLKKISLGTDGEYFNSQNAEGLRKEFQKIKGITVDLVSDKDGDGLSDYHEQRIRIFNGIYKNTDINDPDSDDDNLLDGKEIYPVYQTINGENIIYYYKLLSDPTNEDSDGDCLPDNEDPNRLSTDLYIKNAGKLYLLDERDVFFTCTSLEFQKLTYPQRRNVLAFLKDNGTIENKDLANMGYEELSHGNVALVLELNYRTARLGLTQADVMSIWNQMKLSEIASCIEFAGNQVTLTQMKALYNSLNPGGQTVNPNPHGVGNTSGISSKNIVFGSGTKSAQKLNSQMSKRGWTKQLVEKTVDRPYTTRISVNKATGNSATVFYTKRGAYVIVDDVTKVIVQVSDNINPSTWVPDASIINPYIPK